MVTSWLEHLEKHCSTESQWGVLDLCSSSSANFIRIHWWTYPLTSLLFSQSWSQNHLKLYHFSFQHVFFSTGSRTVDHNSRLHYLSIVRSIFGFRFEKWLQKHRLFPHDKLTVRKQELLICLLSSFKKKTLMWVYQRKTWENIIFWIKST